MAWVGTITDAGNAMLAQIVGGDHTLTLLDATAGIGTRAQSDMAAATALVTEVYGISIAGKTQASGAVKVRARVTPEASGYTLKEIGIWAQVDSGARTLFSIHQNTDGIVVPAVADDPSFIFDLICTYAPSNTDNFAVTVDPSSVVTVAEMETAFSNECIVRYKEQTLTSVQKQQARENIGAASSALFSANNVLAITYGGTGRTTSPLLLINLESENQTGVFQESPRPGVTGTLPVAHGGTGMTQSPSLLINLGSETANSIHQPTPRPGVTGTLPVSHGGTGLTASPSMVIALGSTAAANVLQASPKPGVSGILAVANGGTGLSVSPSLRVDLSSNTAANVMQSNPTPGVIGTLPVSHGGTGMTASPSMLVSLGSNAAADVLQASPRPGITGTLPVGNGGTGATTTKAARTNLGLDIATENTYNSFSNLAAGKIITVSISAPTTKSGYKAIPLCAYCTSGDAIVSIMNFSTSNCRVNVYNAGSNSLSADVYVQWLYIPST